MLKCNKDQGWNYGKNINKHIEIHRNSSVVSMHAKVFSTHKPSAEMQHTGNAKQINRHSLDGNVHNHIVSGDDFNEL